MKQKNVVVFVFTLLGLVVAAAFWGRYMHSDNLSLRQDKLADLGFYLFNKPRELTAVPLKNMAGEDGGLADKKGQWQLVNFGYMFCPDICPVNLKLLAKVKTEWDSQNPQLPLAVTAITFDPERDTPENFSKYLRYHNPGFYGLTGKLENIRKLAQQLNVVFIHEKPDEYGNYFITHSDSIALIDPQGLFIGLFKGPYKQDNVEEALRKITGEPL